MRLQPFNVLHDFSIWDVNFDYRHKNWLMVTFNLGKRELGFTLWM